MKAKSLIDLLHEFPKVAAGNALAAGNFTHCTCPKPPGMKTKSAEDIISEAKKDPNTTELDKLIDFGHTEFLRRCFVFHPDGNKERLAKRDDWILLNPKNGDELMLKTPLARAYGHLRAHTHRAETHTDETSGATKTASLADQTFYRGTEPGRTERISTGDSYWDGKLFVADKPEHARNYGSQVDEYHFAPGAKILIQGTRKWIQVAGKWRKGETMHDWAVRSAKAAEAAGYDAVYFTLQGTIGTIVLNSKAISKKAGDIKADLMTAALRAREELIPDRDARGGDCEPVADRVYDILKEMGHDPGIVFGAYGNEPHVWNSCEGWSVDATFDQYDLDTYDPINIWKTGDSKFEEYRPSGTRRYAMRLASNETLTVGGYPFKRTHTCSECDTWELMPHEEYVQDGYVTDEAGHLGEVHLYHTKDFPFPSIASIDMAGIRGQGMGRQVVVALAKFYGGLTSDPARNTSDAAKKMWRSIPGVEEVTSPAKYQHGDKPADRRLPWETDEFLTQGKMFILKG